MGSSPPVDPGFSTAIDCDHRLFGLRRRVYANGAAHFVYQCERCGAAGRSIKRDLALARGGMTAPAFDEGLADRFWEERRGRRAAEAAEASERRRSNYAAYLDSPGWHERRRLRLEADRFVCQARLAGCLARATEVHHLSYRFVGNEPLFDLVSVCRPCHEAISAMEGRATGEGASGVAAD